MKWKRTNTDSGPVHENQTGEHQYKITKCRRALYEVWLKRTDEARCVYNKPLPAHFEWYYLTNFKSPADAKIFVEGYDAGSMGLTPDEREPFEVET